MTLRQEGSSCMRCTRIRPTGGATLPASQLAEPSVDHGFWFEVLRYRRPGGKAPEPIELRIISSAYAAIRAIRIQVRTTHALGMTPRETARAVAWAESGWIQALASLHSGEPCGFTVVLHNGARAEWTVRPVTFLELTPIHPSNADNTR